ncbi:sensor histidine kinase [Myxococcus sp. K15C18031901]|uniref:sensor histidine kinase n=1 Tax=Myxococcus dinghuensis TaxID=2906761 RepID=UPI0020A773DA|nr:sensor histidine kinase [Myxococcus dinghuensis]MCP3099907.1 sensor histidine kinase [Myxococcus dinghuensis]
MWRLGPWTAPGVLSAVETYFFALSSARPIELWRAFATQVPAWYVWVPATPWLFLLARRFPLGRPFQARSVGVHLLAWVGMGGAFGLAYTLCNLALARDMGGASLEFSRMLLRFWLGWLPMMAMAYAAVLGIAHALDSQRREREQERQSARLAVELADARLQALQTQLHPHFLFNTLNAIVVLVREKETDAAARMLVALSDILRRLLQQGATQEVSLREEVSLLSRYLEIQQLRFQDRLRVSWEVEDAVLDARVPYLVLQPLVENAIRHGVSMRTAAGALTIRARHQDGVLTLMVEDDGPGLPAAFSLERGAGIGLANTRERLTRLYGDAGRLGLTSRQMGTGVVATVELPLRRGEAGNG